MSFFKHAQKLTQVALLFVASLSLAWAADTFTATWNSTTTADSFTGSITFTDITSTYNYLPSNLGGTYNTFDATASGISAFSVTYSGITYSLANGLIHNIVRQSTGLTFTDLNIFMDTSQSGCSMGSPPQLNGVNRNTIGDCVTGERYLLDLASFNLLVSASANAVNLQPSADALRGAYNLQSAIINTGLNYDCTTFDERGICLSAGGRITDTVNPATNSQGALVIASYRANDNWRIGGYLDQNLSTNDARGVNLDNSNPMGGVFAVWNQNTDGTGYQVRVAAGYSDNDVTVTRSAVGNSQIGSGDSSLQSQAYSATISRGFQINDTRWIASPYLGVRYTKIKRAGYTEDSTTDVTAPLTYSALSQETTTALAGVRFNGQFGDKLNVLASAGVESDIAHNTGDYAATGVNGLTPIAFNQNIRHVRPVAQAGVRYAIDKRQTVGANLNYRQEAFNSTHSVMGMVNYEIGF